MKSRWILAIGAACVFVAVGVSYLVVKRQRRPERLPSCVAWVEHLRDGKGKDRLYAWPLFSLRGGVFTDISKDPEDDKNAIAKLDPTKFLLARKPQLEAYQGGKLIGTVNVESLEAVQVSCNALVLAKVAFAAGSPTQSKAAPKEFLAGFGLPAQQDWGAALSENQKSEMGKLALSMARNRLSLPEGMAPKEVHLNWFKLGSGLGDALFASVTFQDEENHWGWNAVLKIAKGGLEADWEESAGTTLDGSDGIPVYGFLGAMDVDGDACPELVLGYHRYENNGFVVLRVGAGKTKAVWAGSGYGC